MMRTMEETRARIDHEPRVLALKLALLAVWALVSFGVCWFARHLQFSVLGWPFAYWWTAQGAVLAFIAIVVGYALVMNRWRPEDREAPPEGEEGA